MYTCLCAFTWRRQEDGCCACMCTSYMYKWLWHSNTDNV